MGKTAILAVKIISDSRDAVKGLDDTGSKFGKLRGLAAKAGAGMAIAGGAAVAFGVDAIKSASNLQQSAGAVNDIFKSGADKMRDFADNASQAVGLSKNEYNELAAVIGSQLKNGGTSIDKLAGKTNDLISTGADLSAMFGGSTKDAVDALSSALKGERDPIERYGVSLKQASIDAEAARLGFKKVGGSLSTEATQAATLSLIMKQTKDAHGKFAAESDTLAGKQQRLSAQFEDTKAAIGEKLLPVATALFGYLNDTAAPALGKVWDWLSQLDFSGLGSDLSGLSPILDSITSGWDKISASLTQAWTDLQPMIATVRDELIPNLVSVAKQVIPPLISAIMSIIPPLISAGVAVAGLVVQIQKNMIPVIKFLAPIVTTVFKQVAKIIKAALAVVTAIIKTATALIKGDWSGVWKGIKSIVKTTLKLIGSIIKSQLAIAKSIMSAGLGALKGLMSRVWNGIKSVVSSAWDRIKSSVSNGASRVVSEVRKLPGKAKHALGGLGHTLYQSGKDLISGFISGIWRRAGDIASTIKNAVTDKIPGWIKGPLGINSPSRVMADIAQWIPAGIAAGIAGNAHAVRDAMRELSGDVVNAGLGSPTLPAVELQPAQPAAPAGAGRPPVVVNVNGALDPVSVARQIRDLLDDYAVLVGA